MHLLLRTTCGLPLTLHLWLLTTEHYITRTTHHGSHTVHCVLRTTRHNSITRQSRITTAFYSLLTTHCSLITNDSLLITAYYFSLAFVCLLTTVNLPNATYRFPRKHAL